MCRRGEVYWVRVDGGFGSETGVGRPGLILSNAKAAENSDVLVIAWLTTQLKENPCDVLTYATGKRSYVMCNQLTTIDRGRLGKIMGELSPDDMKKVDAAVADELELERVDPAVIREKETECGVLRAQNKDLRAEVAELKEKLSNLAGIEDSYRVENAMWQRLYEKALDQVCSMKLTGDLARRSVVVEKPVPAAVEAEVEEKPSLLDLNTAKFDELRKVGFSNNIALNVINRRPYTTVEDLRKVPGVTKILYDLINKRVCVIPVAVEEEPTPVEKPVVSAAVEKVNVNTASAKEMSEKLGMSLMVCYGITGYRKEHGSFGSLEDLLKTPRFKKSHIEKYGDLLTV